MVTHRYSIDEAQEAYEAAADEAGDASAVFLYPSGQVRERGSSRLLSGGNLSAPLGRESLGSSRVVISRLISR